MTPRKNAFVLVGVASLVPASCFVFPFICGFLNLSQVSLMLLVPIVLFGSILSAVIVAWRIHGVGKLSRIGIGLMAWVAIVAFTVVAFLMFPAGAKIWTLGFAANFRLTKHPREIQQWASEVLDRYEAGRLNTATNAPYWAIGKQKLEAREVPGHIGTLWRSAPSIGIVTMTSDGLVTDSVHTDPSWRLTHCVAFSWYLTGILVGRSDFRSAWNPWYIYEIMPGVYAYSGMK